MKSCINCSSRQFDTKWITCECVDGTGSWYISSLDLSKFLLHFFFLFLVCQFVGGHKAVADRFSLDEGIRYNLQWHVLACYNTRGALDD